jgi:hypothetical protein
VAVTVDASKRPTIAAKGDTERIFGNSGKHEPLHGCLYLRQRKRPAEGRHRSYGVTSGPEDVIELAIRQGSGP